MQTSAVHQSMKKGHETGLGASLLISATTIPRWVLKNERISFCCRIRCFHWLCFILPLFRSSYSHIISIVRKLCSWNSCACRWLSSGHVRDVLHYKPHSKLIQNLNFQSVASIYVIHHWGYTLQGPIFVVIR